MAEPRKVKSLLPQITVPMHESQEAFRIKLEQQGVEDTRATGLLRGIGEVDEKLTRINEVREKILKDRTLNEAAKKAEFLKYVRKARKEAEDRIFTITKAVDKHSDELSATINHPIVDEASGRDAMEIRSWANQNLKSESERMDFIKKRIDEGDWETASALLGRKSYLSGLKPENKKPLVSYYQEKRFAKEYNTIEALQDIGHAMLHKVVMLEKFERALSNPATLADIEAQEARKNAISR